MIEIKIIPIYGHIDFESDSDGRIVCSKEYNAEGELVKTIPWDFLNLMEINDED